MGFFFENQTPKPDKKAKQKRGVETLNRLGCSACPLNHAKVKSPKMQPTLAEDTWVYFLGEAPGGDEDAQGKPFVGRSGQLLRSCIPHNILGHCSFDNVIRDRPSVDNRDPTFTEIECCRPNIIKSIEEAKPRVIVGVGRFALQWALGSNDTAGLRGRLVAVKVGNHECWFLPTYHPSFVMRTAFNKEKPLNSKFGLCLQLDVKRACAKAVENKPPLKFTEQQVRGAIRTFNGEDEIFEYLAAAKRAPHKAVDIETDALRPYGHNSGILACAFSFGSTHFSFALDHAQSRYSDTQRLAIRKAIKEILLDDTIKIAHNAPFEVEWFAHLFGKECIRHEVWECTQLQAHLLDERKPERATGEDEEYGNPYLGLNFLCKQWYGAPFKPWFKVDRKHIAQSDLQETLQYNAADTFFTLALWGSQNAELRARGLYAAYEQALPRQVTVALTQYLGMPVSQAVVKKLQPKLADEIAVLEAEIDELEVVKKYTQDNGGFNPLGDDCLTIFRDYLKRKEVIKKVGDKVKYSVAKDVLESIDHPLSKLITRLRNKTKMKSTYVDGLELGKGKLIWPDGHLHCNFNTTSTSTGRTSSDSPNMQNFPSRMDAWIREQIVAPDGYLIVAADYGQLEACGAAMCSKDETLVRYLWDNYDTHMAWAQRTAKKMNWDISDPKAAKALRTSVKGGLVFASFYGATAKKVAQSINVPIDVAEELQEELWEMFPQYKRWQEQLLRRYREVGYVESPTGRRRHYPLTSNEAINAPIQCLACDIVVDAMQRLSYYAATTKQWHLHPRLNIHDDLTFIVPQRSVEESVSTIVEFMLTPTFGPDIINVPLSVEVKMGPNWYNMTELGKFSTKDL